MHFGVKTENERVATVCEINSVIDHAQRDMKMIHFPDWRSPNIEKFKDQNDFERHSKQLGLNSNSVWKVPPIIEHPDEVDPYIDGLEKRGNDLGLRQRNKTMEVDVRIIYRLIKRKNSLQKLE